MKKGVLIDKTTVECEVVDFEDTLETLCQLLDCEFIDITVRKIGNKYYNIVCDDEGLLKEDIRVTAFDKDKNPALVGNLLIMNADDCGELFSLTEEDIKNIKKYVHTYLFPYTGAMHCVLTDIDF